MPLRPQVKVKKDKQGASPLKPAPSIPQRSSDVDVDLEDTAELQTRIDASLIREMSNVATTVAGIVLRPLSMAAVMRLHQVNNEIMAGKQIKDMVNPLYSAAEFLFSMDESNPLENVNRLAFGPYDDWRMAVSLWAEKLDAEDSFVIDVITFINDATSTRVKAKLPDALKGSASEGNAFTHRGL